MSTFGVIEQRSLAHLRVMTQNPAAQFHTGQLEAIVELVEHNRQLLVVQKTGWGKSAVYFIACKLLLEEGGGPAIIISPLIALMRNQVLSAGRLGLDVVTVNSSLKKNERDENEREIVGGQADAVIIAPEQLANDTFVQGVLSKILPTVSLFVVDEAHCISDWGHDFRPDYRRIVRILQAMPNNLPVLATTATANNRVVTDIQQQLGEDILISRGELTREALHLQNLSLMPKAYRLAWLLLAMQHIPGTGIIYAKTIRDCEQVADWLFGNGINAKAYTSESNADDRIELEDDLLGNRVKALVATSALGMGFDKPDISFVIHYQAPANVVEYYQQVGRAGRGIADAHGILMMGEEDERIQQFFIERAFPSQDEVDDLLQAIEAEDGLKKAELEKHTNLSKVNIEKALKFLSSETPSPVLKDGSEFYSTAIDYQLPAERIERLSAIKTDEWEQLQSYSSHDGCLMRFLAEALDDTLAEDCGKCAVCDPASILNFNVSRQLVLEAGEFLKYRYVKIKPRKLFASSGALAADAFKLYRFPYKNPDLQAEEGLALSRWRDGVWGDLVAKGKAHDHFSDELIEPMVKMVQSMAPNEKPSWLTYVPSPRHPTLVKQFAHRLASALGIQCSDAVSIAIEKPPQKSMENSFRQSENLDGAFHIDPDQVYRDPVFLLDDAVDSRWTLTVVAALLKQTGAGKVYPVALTSTSNQG